MTKGIDISKWQGNIDFSKIPKDINFVMIKAGGSDNGFYIDRNFEKNYYKARMEGFNIGCYYFVGPKFLSADDGVADARRFLEIIKGKSFEYPIALDIESTPFSKRSEATKATIAFCDELEKAGYYVVIYGSDISTFKDRLNIYQLSSYDKWVARYGSCPSYVKTYGIWQYTYEGHIEGIEGYVDINISYRDYPSIIKRKGLNKCEY